MECTRGVQGQPLRVRAPTMWVLGTELRSSGSVTHDFTHWAISPVPWVWNFQFIYHDIVKVYWLPQSWVETRGKLSRPVLSSCCGFRGPRPGHQAPLATEPSGQPSYWTLKGWKIWVWPGFESSIPKEADKFIIIILPDSFCFHFRD